MGVKKRIQTIINDNYGDYLQTVENKSNLEGKIEELKMKNWGLFYTKGQIMPFS
jgi:hypothetical protein